ncbi:MAG: flippase-like domain-containing protein [Bacteroidetes bacterium]|nr:flippase-like domain-containing protein [Bacteroidota bacterium]
METKSKKIDTTDKGSIRNKILSAAVRIIVSAVILYFVFSLVTWDNIVSAYRSADGRYIFLGGCLLAANLGIRTLKWRIMLHSVKRKPAFKESFGSVMLGISLGSFTPGEVGEFAGRALHISDAKKSHLVGLALLDKAQIFVVTFAAGAISLVCLFFNNVIIIAALSCLIAFLSYAFFLRMDMLAKIGHRLNSSFFKRPWLTRVLDGFTLLKPKQLLSTLICTVTFHFILVIQMCLFIHAFEDISFLEAFAGTSAMMFVKSCLPISLGDLGIREAGSVFFFSKFGVSQAAALNASLLLFVINVLIPSVCGIVFLKNQHAAAWTSFRKLLSKPKDKSV